MKRNLLFLKSIDEIVWTDGVNRGRYVKKVEKKDKKPDKNKTERTYTRVQPNKSKKKPKKVK